MLKKYDVVVVGAGASGLIAAFRSAEQGANVLLIEKMKEAGRKLLITGKGRCNISNDAPQSVYYKNIYPNGRFLKHAFSRFFVKDIVDLLAESDVPVNVERGNRIFPVSNNSRDVQQAFLNRAQRSGAEILYQTSAEKLLVDNGEIIGIQIKNTKGLQEISCTNIILCTGGKSYPATGSTGDGYLMAKTLGHTIIDTKPSLVPLEVSGNIVQKLQGLSLKNCNAVLWVNERKQKEEFGELLFTHFGLSGPVILTLSRSVVQELDRNKKVEISIDLKPALDEQKLDARLLRDIDAYGKKHLENLFKQWLPSKLIPVFFEILHLDKGKLVHQLSSRERKSILLLMKDFRFTISGYRGFKEAVITSGGISTDEIDNKTMQSRLVEGLYFAGEIIDVDGNTGGYNLQIAYSTAWLAADSCLKKKIASFVPNL
jgi:predicted Rossmann fold flavoprotein